MSSFVVRPREQGQTMAEYAVILGVITPIIVLMFAMLSERIASSIESVAGVFLG